MDNKIDMLNDSMSVFFSNQEKIKELYDTYLEKLGDNHLYSKTGKEVLTVLTNFLELYPLVEDKDKYVSDLTELSDKALKLLSYKPYELMEGGFFKRRKSYIKEGKEREEAWDAFRAQIKVLNEFVSKMLEKKEE